MPMRHAVVMSLLLIAARNGHADDSVTVNPLGAKTPDTHAATAPAGDKLQLQLHVRAGQTYVMRVGFVSKVTEVWDKPPADVPWRRMESTTTEWVTMPIKIVGVAPDGTTACRLTIQSIRLVHQGNEDDRAEPTVRYDTAHPGVHPEPWAAPIQAMTGKTLMMKMTPDGRTVNAGATAKSLTRLLGTDKTDEGASEGQQADDTDSVKQMLEQASLGFPKAPVGVGESWPYTYTMTGSYPCRITLRRTLVQRTNGVARIQEAGAIQVDNTRKPIIQHGYRVFTRLNGTMSGTNQVDEATGFTQRRHVEQHFDGPLTTRSPATQWTPAQEIHVHLYGKNTIDLVTEPMAAPALPASTAAGPAASP